MGVGVGGIAAVRSLPWPCLQLLVDGLASNSHLPLYTHRGSSQPTYTSCGHCLALANLNPVQEPFISGELPFGSVA